MRKQSVLLLIIALLAGPIAGSVRAELVGHWPLNEGAGVTANDTSGYNNHGTLKNGPKWVAGALGQALELDGVDDFVEIPHSDSLTVSKEVTVTAWIRATQYTGTTGAEYQGIVAKSNSPPLLQPLPVFERQPALQHQRRRHDEHDKGPFE